jgi:O-antigen ligase
VGVPLLPGRVRVAALAATVLLAALAVATHLHAGYVHAILASRGNFDSSGRTGGAAAAFALVAHHPLTGTGVGRSAFLYTTPGGNGSLAKYAHNEYLQALVDLGAIGFALLAGLLAAVVVAVRRGHAHPGRPGVRAGAIAALAALAVHSGFDFLWHIAVIPLAVALLIGLAGPADREDPSIQRGKVTQ